MPSTGAPQPVRATGAEKHSVGSTFPHIVCRTLCRLEAAGQIGPRNTLINTMPATTTNTKNQEQDPVTLLWDADGLPLSDSGA